MPAKIEKVWLCYGAIGCHFNPRENGHVTDVVTLMEGEWSYYGGSQFKGGRIVIVRRWPVYGGRMYMLWWWSV